MANKKTEKYLHYVSKKIYSPERHQNYVTTSTDTKEKANEESTNAEHERDVTVKRSNSYV